MTINEKDYNTLMKAVVTLFKLAAFTPSADERALLNTLASAIQFVALDTEEENEDEGDADIAMRESLGTNWW